MFVHHISVLLQLALVLSTSGAPLNSTSTTDKKQEQTQYNFANYDEVYDQRQNGTENLKVDVNGVMLVWAPQESLFSVASLLNPTLFEIGEPDLDELLIPPPPPPSTSKPSTGIAPEGLNKPVSSSTNAPGLNTREVQAHEDESNLVLVQPEYIKRYKM